MLPPPAARHQSSDLAQAAARLRPSNASPGGESTRAAEATSSGIEGSARGVQFRSESDPVRDGKTISILTFRVERLDADGSHLSPVAVEMRGKSLTGILNEADRVRVPGTWQVGQTIEPQLVHNLTTGAEVRVVDQVFHFDLANEPTTVVMGIGAVLLVFTVFFWSVFFDDLIGFGPPLYVSLIPGLIALLLTAGLAKYVRAVIKARKRKRDQVL